MVQATPRPSPLPISPAAIPAELTAQAQWVCWAYEYQPDRNPAKPWTKVPKCPATGRNASSTNARTWGPFAQAFEHYRGQNLDGVGFILTAGDPYVAVDLDDCCDLNTGAIQPWARAIIERLRSYTEISPSGTGLRILARGRLPPGGRKRGPIEVYDRARYVTVTGCRLNDLPATIEDRTSVLSAWHAEVFGVPRNGESHVDPRADSPWPLSDDEILAKALAAANGQKFAALWGGDVDPYLSHSEADLALCCLLAFWTRHGAQIDRLFRRSGLYREKWDARHGDTTYGERTIARALDRVATSYHISGQPGEDDEPHLTDLGNAYRFIQCYRRDLRHVHGWGRWLSWEQQRWAADERGRIGTRAAELVLGLFHRAAAEIADIEKAFEGGHDADERRSRAT